jgi:ankyrin repeat protein
VFLPDASPIGPISSNQKRAHTKSVVQRLSFLLDNGASVSAKDNSNTALGHAIRSGHIEAVTLLLDHGADPKEECCPGVDALSLSITTQQFAIAGLFIKHGASVAEYHVSSAIEERADSFFVAMLIGKCKFSQSQFSGHAALASAVSRSRMDVVQTLIEAGVEINLPALSTREHAIVRAAKLGCAEILNYLISHGGRLDLSIEEQTVGNLAMHRAAEGGHPAIIRLLLHHGTQVLDGTLKWHQLEMGHTMLCRAARHGDLECVRLFVQNGAGLEARCGDGHTALMQAAEHGRVEIVQALLSTGADINAQCESGHTPFCRTFSLVFTEHTIQPLLREAGADPERCRSCASEETARRRQEMDGGLWRIF